MNQTNKGTTRFNELVEVLSRKGNLLTLRDMVRDIDVDGSAPQISKPERSKRRNLLQALKLGQRLSDDSMETLRQGLNSLDDCLRTCLSLPQIWKIGGSYLLVEEFLMPALYEIESKLDILKNPNNEKIQLETENIGFAGSALYDAVSSGRIQVAIAHTKRFKADGEKKFRIFKLDNDELKEANPDSKTHSSAISRLDIGRFHYNLYIPTKLLSGSSFQSIKQIPLISSDHCPIGVSTLNKIAENFRYNIGHKCTGIPAAMKALMADDCKYGAILPSYLTDLPDLLASQQLRSITLEEPEEELRDHSISLLWKETWRTSCPQPKERPTQMLISMAQTIENRIAQPDKQFATS